MDGEHNLTARVVSVAVGYHLAAGLVRRDNKCTAGLMHHKRMGDTSYGAVFYVLSAPVCQFWLVQVQELVRNGAAVSVTNGMGETPVMLAAQASDVSTVKFLNKAGAAIQSATERQTAFKTMLNGQAVDELGSTDGWARVPGKSPQTVAGGGWSDHNNKAGLKHEISHCDIDRRDDLTPEEFMTEYVDKLKPVILGPKVLKGNWSASHEWSKRRLKSVFGDVLVEGGVDQKMNQGQKDAQQWVSLATFIDRRIDAMEHTGDPAPTDTPPYVLEPVGTTRKLLKHVGEIGVFNYSQLELASFLWFLGPAFSGAPNHYHGHALNILVHGAKRWFLTPPPHARYDLKSGWEWYAQDYMRVKQEYKIYECMQYEAEVIYVPHSWGHVVLNTRTSVGYAGEFKFYGEQGAEVLSSDAASPNTLGKAYERLVQKKSQYAVWDKRAWQDHPLLARDFL